MGNSRIRQFWNESGGYRVRRLQASFITTSPFPPYLFVYHHTGCGRRTLLGLIEYHLA
jgi:hypothetical protein